MDDNFLYKTWFPVASSVTVPDLRVLREAELGIGLNVCS